MSRTETTELTVLCLIHDGERYLLQDRVSKDWKGYTTIQMAGILYSCTRQVLLKEN